MLELYLYDPFGHPFIFAPNGYTQRNATAIDQAYGFTNQRFDYETGLWYFKHRYLDDGLGRFISRDPAGYVDGMNLYAAYFVLTGTDPLGLYGVRDWWRDTLEGASAAVSYWDNKAGEAERSGNSAAAFGATALRQGAKVLEIGTNQINDAPANLASTKETVSEIASTGITMAAHSVGMASDEELAFQQERIGGKILDAGAAIKTEAEQIGKEVMEGNVDAIGDRLLKSGVNGLGGSLGAKIFGGRMMNRADSPELCFVAGTPVARQDGSIPIEQVRVGQRVLTRGSQDRQPAPTSGTTEGDDDEDDPHSTEVDPSTWRLVRLEVENIWPDGTVDLFEVVTLQPPAWLEQNRAKVGASVPAPLDLAEMGLPDLLAKVVAIEPCPMIEPGPGRVVLTTVNHLNTYVWELTVEDDEGATETLQPTGWHRFYSTSREDWLPTNELAVGERLRSRTGEVIVVSLAHRPGTERVYNLTVEADHVYYVGSSHVLAHNNCPEGLRDRGPNLGQTQGREFRTDSLETYEFDPNQPSHVRGWLNNERRRIDQGQADTSRNPPGYVQAHGRSTPAREGYDYSNSKLQGEDLNKLEEKIRRKKDKK